MTWPDGTPGVLQFPSGRRIRGRGRTGTALACLAVLDGVPAGEAVAWVRAHYDPRAVETPFQARFVRRFG